VDVKDDAAWRGGVGRREVAEEEVQALIGAGDSDGGFMRIEIIHAALLGVGDGVTMGMAGKGDR
jgi:hypothetical protein